MEDAQSRVATVSANRSLHQYTGAWAPAMCVQASVMAQVFRGSGNTQTDQKSSPTRECSSSIEAAFASFSLKVTFFDI